MSEIDLLRFSYNRMTDSGLKSKLGDSPFLVGNVSYRAYSVNTFVVLLSHFF